MKINDILKHLDLLHELPKKRIKKDIMKLDQETIDSINNIFIIDKDSLFIELNTHPNNLIFKIPSYYPFRNVDCEVKFILHNKNKAISKILSHKIPNDLLFYQDDKTNLGLFQYIDNYKKIDFLKYIHKKYNNDEIIISEKLSHLKNTCNCLFIENRLQTIINCYKKCMSE